MRSVRTVACLLAFLVVGRAWAQERSVLGTIRAKNSAGRSGYFYLPANWKGRTLPVLVLFHGDDGDAAGLIGQFRGLADEYGFVVIAPESRVSPTGQFAWEVGDKPGEITEDLRHVRDCLNEVESIAGLSVDDSHVLAAGYSGGGSTAPYAATHIKAFTAFAILHGGVFPGGLGKNRPRAWISTGRDDPARPPAQIALARDALAPLFPETVAKLYTGGHKLSDAERRDVIRWWLGC